MKKFFQSKGFIVSSLALLCVTILGVCWFVSRDRTGDFRPDESPPSSVTGDWSDGGTQTDGDNGADAYAPGQSTDAEEEYPKVTSQTEDEVVIDFTDTEKPEETLPPVPEGKTEIKDPGQEHSIGSCTGNKRHWSGRRGYQVLRDIRAGLRSFRHGAGLSDCSCYRNACDFSSQAALPNRAAPCYPVPAISRLWLLYSDPGPTIFKIGDNAYETE